MGDKDVAAQVLLMGEILAELEATLHEGILRCGRLLKLVRRAAGKTASLPSFDDAASEAAQVRQCDELNLIDPAAEFLPPAR